MERDSPWTRRTSRPSITSRSSEGREAKPDAPSRQFSSSKRFPGLETSGLGRVNTANGGSPLTAINTSSPGASSAFGLGSGAFASFGSASKAPKTPTTAIDLSKSTVANEPASASTDVEQTEKSLSRSTTQKASDQASLGVKDSKQTWHLRYSWIMWYRPPTSKNSDYEKSIKPMYKASTAQDFWKIYIHLKRPSMLPIVSDYHFFKEGIRPVWEDEENKKGGKWIMRFKKGVMDRYWDEMLLAIVGDQFAEAGEEVCGMVVSVRSGEDVLSVWTKNDGGRNVKIRETIKRVLALPADTVIIWKSHDDSIAQRSAIEQARQDKGGSDKRRNTLTENTAPNPKDKP